MNDGLARSAAGYWITLISNTGIVIARACTSETCAGDFLLYACARNLSVRVPHVHIPGISIGGKLVSENQCPHGFANSTIDMDGNPLCSRCDHG
jgi:hypothetical protein